MFGLGKVWRAGRRIVDGGLSHLGIVRREYVVEQYLRAGALFGEALSYLYMGESVDFSKLRERWAMFERQYAALGYRTISVDDFIEYGGYGVLVDHLLRIQRRIDEPPVLHSEIFSMRYSGGFEPAIDIEHLLSDGKAQTGTYRLPTTKDGAAVPTGPKPIDPTQPAAMSTAATQTGATQTGATQTGATQTGATQTAANQIAEPKAQWVVWRQDDNGNKAEVARRNSHAGATALAAQLEARGHKQMYWVEGPSV